MATSTSHLGLVKPAYTDAADVAVINNNMDTIDTAISNILPVITGSTNNSGYTIATGHYFEANGSVYKATASIGVGSSWSGSASAVSGTALNEAVTSLSSNIAKLERGLTYVENGDTIAANAAYTAGKFICWQGEMYRIKATINAMVTSGNWTTYLDKMDGMGGALSQINADLTSLNDRLTQYGVERVELTTSLTIDANTEQEISLTILNKKVGCYTFISAMICDNGGFFDNIDFLKIVGIKNVWNSVWLCIKNTDIASHTYNNLKIFAYVHAI